MKKPLLIIIVLLLVGIGVAVFVNFPKTHTQQQETPLSGEIISSWNITSWATDFLSGVSGEITSWTIQLVTWTTNTQSNNPLVYTNTEFWFQLTLPKWWEDYKAFVYRHKQDTTYPWTIASISIALPTKLERYGPEDPNKATTDTINRIPWYAEMLTVWIWFKSDYKKEYERCFPYPNASCTTILNFLWSNTDYNFTSFWPQEMPKDLYEKRWDGGEPKYILPIFKSLD